MSRQTTKDVISPCFARHIAITLEFLKKPPCDFVSGRFAGFATLGEQCLPLKGGKDE